MSDTSSLDYLNDALIRAAARGHTATALGLVALGADIHSYQESPLRLAAHNGHQETVIALATAGADLARALLVAASMAEGTAVRHLMEYVPNHPVVASLRSAAALPRPCCTSKPPDQPLAP